MKRYAAPLRLTWDWSWPAVAHPGSAQGRPSPEAVRAIGAEIVRSGVLLLEIGYPDPAALCGGELAAALEGFAGSLSLVLTPAAAAALAGTKPWERWAGIGVEEVWLDMTPGCGSDAQGLGAWPMQRFYLSATNFHAVADAIDIAMASGAVAISLPNLPLFGEVLGAAGEATPSVGQLEELARRAAAAQQGRAAVDLRVHHYGLWRSLCAAGLHPHGEGAPGAGCQAGNALAYIDPSGVLYPCASLPVPLARIGPGAVAEAWAGPGLAELRERIARVPAACSGCPFEAGCRGGCRGWAHYLSGSWSATGPDCVKP